MDDFDDDNGELFDFGNSPDKKEACLNLDLEESEHHRPTEKKQMEKLFNTSGGKDLNTLSFSAPDKSLQF
jgi:hypothetical protein